MRASWVVLALFVLAAPAASAQVTQSVIGLEFGASEVWFKEESRLMGDDASDLRRDVDEDYGNDDGFVTRDEMERMNRDAQYSFDRDYPECFRDWRLATIDGKTPLRVGVAKTTVQDAVGAVTSTASIRESTSLSFEFATSGPGARTVVMELDELDSDAFGEALGCYFQKWGMAQAQWTWAPPPGCCDYEWGTSNWSSESEDWSRWGGSWNWTFSSGQQATEGDAEAADVLLAYPVAGTRIVRESVQPAAVRALWDGTGLRADTEGEKATLLSSRATFEVEASTEATWGGTVRDVGAYVGYATIGGSLLLVGLGLSSEFGRYHLWRFLFLVPGFTRLEKDEVLEHTKRDELYRFIKQNPGPSFSDLRRELSVPNGTLVHHLRILEAQEYVKAVRDGFRTRFYVRGPKIIVESYLTRTQQHLLEAISGNPGLTQKELAQVLGLPRESISYHTKQLAAKGRLLIRQDGKWRRYWPSTAAPATPAAAA